MLVGLPAEAPPKKNEALSLRHDQKNDLSSPAEWWPRPKPEPEPETGAILPSHTRKQYPQQNGSQNGTRIAGAQKVKCVLRFTIY